MDFTLALAGFAVPVLLVYWLNKRSSKSLEIPGPPAHPFVGHTFKVPTTKTWKYYENLAHEYGPIMKLTLAGDDILVLSDPADAQELLGRRSRIYSSRRPLIYAGKYQSNHMRFTLLPYGESFRRQLGAFHQMLEPRAVGGYQTLQLTMSLRLLKDMAKAPTEFFKHIPRFPASLVFALSFGRELKEHDLAEVQKILADFVFDINPGAHLVDTFPMLDLLPDFLSPWRAEARRKRVRELALYGGLCVDVKKRMEKDPELECFTARLWDQQEKFKMPDEEIFYIVGTGFASGTGTSAATMLWFVMAMVLNPEAAKKAQAEIDTVFNADTLPDFSRMKDLPYCFALLKEVIRWSPVVPLSFPHYLDAEDEYKGYKIKKGTTVISSLWNMHHNEKEFPNSYKFEPERFMTKKPGQTDGMDNIALGEGMYGFGFGRRECPGQQMGTKSAWIAIVRLLWAFNIEAVLDSSGNSIPIDTESCTEGLTCRPHAFPANFVARSAAHIETIMSS
ncbi:cytochrome P450 [Mycena albidolilacea]|uniref:Cytochrome P450 n=1 Tax=Mycena albidolilacea TaxID=1033008 RepID=A0AAD6Z4Q7_9AGAR|nr:cytochrome P450 [Mycena albidolilacea]